MIQDQDIEVEIDSINYKIGRFGYVYMKLEEEEWVKSNKKPEEIHKAISISLSRYARQKLKEEGMNPDDRAGFVV